MKTETINLK